VVTAPAKVLEAPIYIPSFDLPSQKFSAPISISEWYTTSKECFHFGRYLSPTTSGFPSHGASERHSSMKQP
jgi:hypothetical protein